MIKTVYVGFAFLHHKGTQGGYHHILNYAKYDYIVDAQNDFERLSSPHNNIVSKIIRRVFRIIFCWDTFPLFLFRCLWLGYTKKELVFHFIYGENLYTPLFRLIPKRHKIVCTFHQPFEWFNNPKWLKVLQSVDKIILVGNTEISKFKEATGKDNVVYIPHGVTTDFYKPDSECQKKKMILTVGNWLRNYEIANRVYLKFLEENPDWIVSVVANQNNLAKISDQPNIIKYSGISDTELKRLYCESSVLFLPLIRYTANNSLLEASACGCNILIASNYADNSYIPIDYIRCVPMSEEQILCFLKDDANHTSDYNNALRQYVVDEFSWQAIGLKTNSYLRAL